MTNQLMQAVGDALDRGRPTGDDDGGRETIDNRERGCGHLRPNSCYVRSDVAALSSADGEIPRFVELDDPVEYRENNGKGAIIPGFVHFPGVSFSLHYDAEGKTTTPEGDIPSHVERLGRFGFDGDHYGDITSAHSHDLLMSVGKTNWETPEDFVAETRDRGLNLKIGVSSNSPPPVIEPLRTRVWIIHPHGAGEDRPAIIGYSYLTRNVFTTGTKASDEDPDIPKWAENYAKTRDDLDVVDRGEPIAEDEPAYDPNQTRLADHEDDAAEAIASARDTLAGSVDDVEPDDDTAHGGSETEDDARSSDDERDVATLTIADGDAPGDVSGIEVEFGRDDAVTGAALRSFAEATNDGPLTYNALKTIAGKRDEVDVGSTPSQDDLIGALVKQAGAIVPAYYREDDADSGTNE